MIRALLDMVQQLWVGRRVSRALAGSGGCGKTGYVTVRGAGSSAGERPGRRRACRPFR